MLKYAKIKFFCSVLCQYQIGGTVKTLKESLWLAVQLTVMSRYRQRFEFF